MKILFLVLGIPLVMVALTIILNRIPSSEERRKGEASQTPGVSKAKRRFGPVLVIILLLLLIGGLVGWGVLKKNVATSTDTANKAYEYEYKLSAGQKIYTQVAVGPEVILRILANQPFSVIASQLQPDESIKIEEYIMPAGESGWLGGEPTGVFTIQGITNDTLVKISRQ